MFHLHKWSKWAFLKNIKHYNELSDMPYKTTMVQLRSCEVCGKLKTKRSKI